MIIMLVSKSTISNFQETIIDFYQQNGRQFAWRNVDDPYKVVVSELMLQQTQTSRVISKYEQFITEFTDFNSLASASLKQVLTVWQGLGYNRRGKYLHEIAKKIINEHDGIVPNFPEILVKLPGIGKATAASICAFAYNTPTLFIETNIRTVFIHFFFQEKEEVDDKEIMTLVEQTLDKNHPRDWYYALTDYGVMLKQTLINPNRKSRHYKKQSKFDGSDRQIRGKILRVLTDIDSINVPNLIALLKENSVRVKRIIDGLCADGLINKNKNCLEIA